MTGPSGPSERGIPGPSGPSERGIRVGITLPQFRHVAEPALEVARRAEGAGLNGVFVFDHLWPLRQPQRPALHSIGLLGALATETSVVTLGPLVARVSVLPNAVLVNAMRTLARIAGGRLVVGLGTGDSGNRDENEAFGIGFPPVERRVADLEACSRALRAAGITTWIGGRARAVMRAAAAADGWNGWGFADAATFGNAARTVQEEVASLEGGRSVELSWGGQVLVGATQEQAAEKLARHGDRPGLVHGTVDDLAGHFRSLAAVGAAWAVCAPLDVGTDSDAVELVAEAARHCR